MRIEKDFATDFVGFTIPSRSFAFFLRLRMITSMSLLVPNLGLKVMMALLTLLLILNIGIANALDSTKTKDDVLVPNAHPPTTDTRNKDFLTSESSSLEIQASSGKLVRRLIGSSAPECGHTCGACSPCKIQIVNFECSNDYGSHAEACPLGYLCICHGKAFPIP